MAQPIVCCEHSASVRINSIPIKERGVLLRWGLIRDLSLPINAIRIRWVGFWDGESGWAKRQFDVDVSQAPGQYTHMQAPGSPPTQRASTLYHAQDSARLPNLVTVPLGPTPKLVKPTLRRTLLVPLHPQWYLRQERVRVCPQVEWTLLDRGVPSVVSHPLVL